MRTAALLAPAAPRLHGVLFALCLRQRQSFVKAPSSAGIPPASTLQVAVQSFEIGWNFTNGERIARPQDVSALGPSPVTAVSLAAPQASVRMLNVRPCSAMQLIEPPQVTCVCGGFQSMPAPAAQHTAGNSGEKQQHFVGPSVLKLV